MVDLQKDYRKDVMLTFSSAKDADDLWSLLHKQLENFSITSVFYGVTHVAFPQIGCEQIENAKLFYFKTSFDRSLWVNDGEEYFVRNDLGVLHCIENTYPRLSSKNSIWLTEDERQKRTALEKDAYEKQRWFREDLRIGVTIPLRSGNYARGGIGLQADGLSSEAFDQIWGDSQEELTIIVQAFDQLAREKYNFFNTRLSPREKDIVFWMSEGCSAKIIADKLGKKTSSIQNRIAMMRKKLEVRNNTQLVAKAFVMELL